MLQRFKFTEAQTPTFTGFAFYTTYKDSDFLRHRDQIESILSRGHQLRARLRDVTPGGHIVIEGLYITKNKPLIIKKGGPSVSLEDHEFTMNRLSGLVAAYVYEHRSIFPELIASEPQSLGLTWDHNNQDKSKLYLAAVSGTEHFYEQFGFYPLICALRKMRLGKLKPEFVTKIARVKTIDGQKMIQILENNQEVTVKMWQMFPGSTPGDFHKILNSIDNK